MNDQILRECPECEHGKLIVRELHRGCRCSYCHKLIEIDFVYSAGIPVLLALLIWLSFNNDFDIVGLILTVSIVLYTAGYNTVWCRFLPIKHYGDSD